MAFVSNHCWGFRRTDLQSGGSCSGSTPLQTRPVRRCLKAQSLRLRREHSSSSSSSNSRHCRHRHSRRKVSASAAGEKTKRGRGAPSNLQPAPPDDGSGRLKDFPFPPVIPGPQLELPEPEGDYEEDEDEEQGEDGNEEKNEDEDEDEEDDEEDPFEFPDDDIRAHGGYTPFEELDWSEEAITHELSVYVDAPRSKCFQMWQDRLNYLEWFDNIGQLIAHRQDPDLVSMFIFYQWASTPMLELYTTLSRSEVHEDEQILEENVDGMDFVAGVLFADAEGKSGTKVTLRLGYYLPEQLNEFVGAIPVYGDVNDILESSMSRMKEFVENIDLKELQQIREDARIQEEQELHQEKEEFHTEFGTEEEIYSKAQEAASEYLADLGVEDEEEDEEDEEPDREPTEEDWDDAPEYGPGEFTPVDEEAVPDYLASVDLDDDDDVNEDPHPTTSELGSLQPGTTAGDAEQVAPAPQQAAAASSRDQARATEQQAAADMSSMLQQDVGQFDEAQAARVSPDSMLPVSSPEGTAPVPDQDGSRQQLGEDVQHQTQHSIGQQSSGVPPQVDQEAAKPKKRAGRPKKKDDDSTPKKKPGRRKKADKKADTAQKGFF